MNTENINKSLRSWKTTIVGVCAALVVVFTQFKNLLDADPQTVFDVNILWQGGLIALIGLFAKDGDKSTEDVT